MRFEVHGLVQKIKVLAMTSLALSKALPYGFPVPDSSQPLITDKVGLIF